MSKLRFASPSGADAQIDRLSGAPANDTEEDRCEDAGVVLVDAEGKCAGGSAHGTPIQVLWRVRNQAVRAAILSAIRAACDSGAQAPPIWIQERGLVVVRAAAEPGYAIIALRRPGWSLRALTAEVIADSFAASPAEAEIGLMLAHGATPAEVAAHRHVRKDTVRSQIKSLMRKVGVNSRIELTVSLIEIGAERSWSSPNAARYR
jgi:DNA-binding CsgD family transcriptional regulator